MPVKLAQQLFRRMLIIALKLNIPGRDIVPVPADQTGLVLVLRCFAQVSAGESLAVVLETDRKTVAVGVS